MPLEPDNQIDKLLKAYAKKRRDRMGAPLDVPPATRKLLQDEVARTFPRRSSAAESWLASLKMFWPRVAFATSILLVLGVGSWSLLKSNREATPMKMSKLERNGEPKARSLESLSTVKSEESLGEAEKKTPINRERAPGDVELGVNQSTREFKTLREEILQPAPSQNHPALDSRDAKDQASVLKREDVAVKEAGQSRMMMRRYGLDQGGTVKPGETPAPVQTAAVTPQQPQPILQRGAEPTLQLKDKAETEDLAKLSVQDPTKRKADSILGDQLSLAPSSAPAPLEAGKKIDIAKRNISPAAGESGFGVGGIAGGAQRALAAAGGARDGDFKDGRALTEAFYFSTSNLRLAETTNSSAAIDLLSPLYSNGSFVLSDLALNRFRNTNQVATTWDAGNERPGLAFERFGEAEVLQRGRAPDSSVLDSASRTAGLAAAAKPDEISQRVLMTNQIALATIPMGNAAKQTSLEYRNEKALAEKSAPQLRSKSSGKSEENQVARSLRSPSPESILASFELTQTGDRIRITETDGSIYEGRLLAIGAEREVRAKIASQNEQTLDAYGRSEVSGPAGGVPFQASGTNRSLNQVVVINGTLTGNPLVLGLNERAPPATSTPRLSAIPPPAAPASAANVSVNGVSTTAGVDGAGKNTTSPANGNAAPWSRMQGKARVGATNEILINAVRVNP
ncbi:MAG TPA: hypothetical protein VFA77_04995 [Candidatus Eisenbacteria bacterium]|jgi:hypothetical protein|nr:hypothetical protein [Candidatus Eisenbacteria bacterium]